MLVGRQRHLLHRSRPGGVVLEALAGGGRLLFSERIHFCACIRLVSSTSPRLHWSSVGGCFAALLFVGGYFAAVLLWQMLYHHCRLVGVHFGQMIRTDDLPSLLIDWVNALPPCLC